MQFYWWCSPNRQWMRYFWCWSPMWLLQHFWPSKPVFIMRRASGIPPHSLLSANITHTKCCAFSLTFIKFNVGLYLFVFVLFFLHALLTNSASCAVNDDSIWCGCDGTGWIFVYVLCTNRDTTATNGCTLIFVYMTYTMLPVRLREALIGGLLLSALHIYLGVCSAPQISWTEVSELGDGCQWASFLFVCSVMNGKHH